MQIISTSIINITYICDSKYLTYNVSDHLTRPMSWPSIGSGHFCTGKAKSIAHSCIQLVAFFHVNMYPVWSRSLMNGLCMSWQNPKDFGSKWKTGKNPLCLHWSQGHLVVSGNLLKTWGKRAVTVYRTGLVSLGLGVRLQLPDGTIWPQLFMDLRGILGMSQSFNLPSLPFILLCLFPGV